ncbi:MAG: UDP-N-acetylglucosamine 4-epimerase [Planctomycetes bacterium]|nr:UDP-N-acetylglucosamine 4-epimerase [Planctomycetota bacterium]
MDNYLVTGGAGFIGSHLAERLLADGHTVTVFDNFSTGRFENIAHLEGRQFRVVEGDIRKPQALAKALKGQKYVLHQAALPSVPRSVDDPVTSNEVNVTGTLNVLVAARESGVKRVVYASSSAAYGDTPTLPKTESMAPQPMSPYAVSKLTGEYYCRVFWENYRLETVALRYFNVFGPRQDPASDYAAAVPKFVTLLLAKQRPFVYGDGKQTRDFTYVENVVEANLLACKAPKGPGEFVNVACGDRVTVAGLVHMIGEIAGHVCEPKLKPARAGDVRHSLADVAKALDVIGYRPRVGLREGLERTVAWYASKRPKPAKKAAKK